MKPSTASQSKNCLTFLSEAETESGWESEPYMVAINRKMKATEQYLFQIVIVHCILHSTWESKGESFAMAGT